ANREAREAKKLVRRLARLSIVLDEKDANGGELCSAEAPTERRDVPPARIVLLRHEPALGRPEWPPRCPNQSLRAYAVNSSFSPVESENRPEYVQSFIVERTRA